MMTPEIFIQLIQHFIPYRYLSQPKPQAFFTSCASKLCPLLTHAHKIVLGAYGKNFIPLQCYQLFTLLCLTIDSLLLDMDQALLKASQYTWCGLCSLVSFFSVRTKSGPSWWQSPSAQHTKLIMVSQQHHNHWTNPESYSSTIIQSTHTYLVHKGLWQLRKVWNALSSFSAYTILLILYSTITVSCLFCNHFLILPSW